MDAYAQRLARIERALTRTLPDAVDSNWISAVAGQESPEARIDWADLFLEPGRALMRRGGKRWRPLVTVFTCEALGGGDAADLFTPFTELPHNGSLIVDDIEDASETRRGKPAIHLLYGEDLAINMGNLMYFLPTVLLESMELEAEMERIIVRDWLAVMRRLHLGQGYDILWHRERELYPQEDAYLRMCRYKTGSLASLAAILGARAARANLETVQRLAEAWEDMGTGFQILDDVKNLTTGIPGKDRGDDIVEGKKSLPVILHVQNQLVDGPLLSELFRRAADEAPQGNWSAVEDAIGILRQSGAIDAAGERGRELLLHGRSLLESTLPDSEGRSLSLGMADQFIETML